MIFFKAELKHLPARAELARLELLVWELVETFSSSFEIDTACATYEPHLYSYPVFVIHGRPFCCSWFDIEFDDKRDELEHRLLTQ